MISTLYIETVERLLICGDLNCAGFHGHINDFLANIFPIYGLRQFVAVRTRGDNLDNLDVAGDRTTVYNLQVSDAGLVSDHKLLLCKDLLL